MADIDDDIELEELINATVSKNNHQYNQEIYYEFEDEDEDSGEIDVNNVVDDIFGDGVGVENESELGIDFENFENFDIFLPESDVTTPVTHVDTKDDTLSAIADSKSECNSELNQQQVSS